MKLENLNTVNKVCKYLKLDAKKVIPSFEFFPEEDRDAMIAHSKLVLVTKAVNMVENKGVLWTPDYTNGEWDKYQIYFNMNDKFTTSGFACNYYGSWLSCSTVGLRLTFKSRKIIDHLMDTPEFFELFETYFTSKK